MHFSSFIISFLTFVTISGLFIDTGQGTTRKIEISKKAKNRISRQMLSAWGLRRPGSKVMTHDSYMSLFMASAYKFHRNVTEDEDIRFNPSYGHLDSSTTYFDFDEKLKKILKHECDVIIAFTPRHLYPDSSITEVFGSNIIEIDFSNEDTDYLYELVHADLYFAVDPKADYTVKQIRLYHTVTDELEQITLETLFSVNETNYVAFNVTKILESWMRQPEVTRRLYVKIVDDEDNSRPLDGLLTHLHTFGVGFFNEGDAYFESRYRRDAGFPEDEDDVNELDDDEPTTPYPWTSRDELEPARTNTCRLIRLFIDFSDLGWTNFVIAPVGYRADYCAGGCPFPLDEAYNPTNHAAVQTVVHMIDKNKTGEAICAPTEMDKPMSLLFLDNDQVRIKKYSDMTVIKCGCH